MKWLGGGKPKKIIKNVRVVTLSDVPPSFLLRHRVIAAIKAEVKKDLRKGLRRVPAGVEADWHYQSLIGRLWDRLRGRK